MALTRLAKGASRAAALEAYPVPEPEDIDACLLYAAVARACRPRGPRDRRRPELGVRLLAGADTVAPAAGALRADLRPGVLPIRPAA